MVSRDAFTDPGLVPHRKRVTDLDPKKEKHAERTVYTLFYLSIVGSVWAIAAYMLFPIESNNVWASSHVCELSIPIDHIRLRTGSVI